MSVEALLDADVAAYHVRRAAEIRLEQAQLRSGRAVIIARSGGMSAKDAWARFAPAKELSTAVDEARAAHVAAVDRVRAALEAT